MIRCFWYEPAPEHGADTHRMENCGDFSSRIQPWLMALAENNTLVQITVDLSGFNREESCALLKELASHASIKVIVQRFRSEHVAEICRATRKTGIVQRFFPSGNHATSDAVVTLTECKEVRFVRFDSTVSDELDPLRTTLSLLRSSNHVSSLCLTVGLKSIRSLLIRVPCFDETEARALADRLTSGRTVSSLCLYPEDYRSALSLIHRLSSQNFSTNYALTEMRLTRCVELGADWFVVSDVVRRNDLLVKRAAQFLVGASRDNYCAAALELVILTPLSWRQ
ncbi:hypothetical protein HPB52_018607 [Rhipicephalus sanguineus]|uniref:Uncharacterized protein n=1 Tax=Rhipicephalus sanguineus TaxID=34632 RepID=A0A9D4PJH5_RHISA|nr:hypothetical protein HPB52_018607 [Rhipicephalus sanguineus]